jgi:uncharacterized YigZ family protein
VTRYPIPAGRATSEEVILRSRFIATAGPAESSGAARTFVDEMRSLYPDASHHCFAFVAGPPGSSAQIGLSDDGEPGGTAGRPMLAVLQGCGIGDIVCVVTRYFGGTKLGTGGLVRAYAGGVKAVVSQLLLTEKIAYADLLLTADYHWVTPVTRALPGYEALIVAQDFGSEVIWHLRVPEERVADLAHHLGELSHGQISLIAA